MNKDWKLKSIDISFEKGYDWEKEEEKKKDRYEGMIKFENGDKESFSFRVKPDMAERYISLISQDIVTAASDLGDRLIESLGLTKQ